MINALYTAASQARGIVASDALFAFMIVSFLVLSAVIVFAAFRK